MVKTIEDYLTQEDTDVSVAMLSVVKINTVLLFNHANAGEKPKTDEILYFLAVSGVNWSIMKIL